MTSSNAFTVKVEPAVVPTADQLYVQMSEQYEGPNWVYANTYLDLSWVLPGGDWLDANNILHGPTPFFTLVLPSATAGYYSSNVMGIVQRMLNGPRFWNDSGFYLKGNVGAGSIGWAPKENVTLNKPAVLEVVTTTGTFNPPLVLDTFLATTGTSQGLSIARIMTPSIFQFNLTGITGTVISATLQLWFIPPSGTYPRSCGIYQLASPPILTAPATQGGTVEQGLAATVASDIRLKDNLWDPITNPTAPVIVYHDFAGDAQINSEWEYGDNRGPNNDNWAHNAIGQGTFQALPQFGGISLGRISILTTNDTGCQLRHLAVDGHIYLPPATYRREFTDIGFQELYFRYLIKIDPDVKIGHIELGTKLAGMDATYGLGPAYEGTGGEMNVGDSKWSYRTEHGRKSAAMPGIYRGFIYAYDFEVAQLGTGIGDFLHWESAAGQFCFREGQIYSVEERVKLNTYDEVNAVWNADGILEIWVDGVKVYSTSNRMMRQHVGAQFNAMPFMNCYHGGTQFPTSDIHYWYGGVCISTQYIGPPKNILAPQVWSVNLAWDASTSPATTGYFLYSGTASGNYPNKINVGLTTTYTATGLLPGTTYYFASTAYDANGTESVYSNEIVVLPP